MVFITAAAVVATGVYSANQAGKAADKAAQGQDRAAATTLAAADQARTEVNNLFPSAQRDFLAGQSGAFDIVGQGIGEQQRLLGAGNMNAQNTTAQGFGNVQNALLGLPVNQQAFAPQGITQSQIPYNPISGQAVPGLGGVPEPSNPLGGLFQGIEANQQARDADTFSGIKTNRDLIRAIDSGELGAKNIDTQWFNELFADDMGGENSFIDRFSKMEPKDLESYLARSGLNDRNKNNFRALSSEISRLSMRGGQ